mgnify:CR=1 FL=1
MEKAMLLGGLREQKADHPIIAEGLRSHDFAVLYLAIGAARAANPKLYEPRLRELAASPFMQALADMGIETWQLRDLLEAKP